MTLRLLPGPSRCPLVLGARHGSLRSLSTAARRPVTRRPGGGPGGGSVRRGESDSDSESDSPVVAQDSRQGAEICRGVPRRSPSPSIPDSSGDGMGLGWGSHDSHPRFAEIRDTPPSPSPICRGSDGARGSSPGPGIIPIPDLLKSGMLPHRSPHPRFHDAGDGDGPVDSEARSCGADHL
jgi:hypothetical protein